MTVTKPSFFIVGSPKCGTTALYEYLKEHPQIFMPKKELYFFGKDFTFREKRAELAYYLSLFTPAQAHQITGEASVWYLYSKTAAEEIKTFNKEAKIIIMLRHPVDMLYSLHSQQLYAGNEDIEVFENALAAEGKRRRGKHIPPYLGCPYEALYYSEVGKYSQQVKRYVEVFGEEKVHIIWFDEFINNTAQVYENTLKFLEVTTDFKPTLAKVNPNKKVRHQGFRNLLKQRPSWLLKTGKILLPSQKIRQQIISKLWAWNTTYTERQPMKEETRTFLQVAFQEDIKRLASLTKKDLTHWLT